MLVFQDCTKSTMLVIKRRRVNADKPFVWLIYCKCLNADFFKNYIVFGSKKHIFKTWFVLYRGVSVQMSQYYTGAVKLVS